jgi:hypothetical protein
LGNREASAALACKKRNWKKMLLLVTIAQSPARQESELSFQTH